MASKEFIGDKLVVVYDRYPHHDPSKSQAVIYVRCSKCCKPVKTTTSGYGFMLCSSCDPKS